MVRVARRQRRNDERAAQMPIEDQFEIKEKTMKANCWKVLSKSRKSVHSLWMGSTHPNCQSVIDYPVGVKVYPPVGKLFVFCTQARAENFCLSHRKTRIIVRACAGGLQAQSICLARSLGEWYDLSVIAAFWQGKPARVISDTPEISDTPKGTMSADWVMCLE